MANTTKTTIIFNPNSTGDGRKNADELRDILVAKQFTTELVETEHAGHGEEIAHQLANENPNAYIVSSSGDGGYHEVINGVLSSNNPSVVTGVLPSGNANDHYNFVHRGDVAERLIVDDSDAIDVLKIETPEWTRYAHSYAGLGVTPQIGEVLTKNSLNFFKESWLVVTHLFKIHPVKLSINNHTQRYDHLVFSTIGKMSKYVVLDNDASVTDGQFEITSKHHGTIFGLLKHFLQATFAKTDDVSKSNEKEFTVLRATTIQLDGEVYDLRKGDLVRVTCEKNKLRCIV